MAPGQRKEERETAHAGEDGGVSESRREGGKRRDLCSVSARLQPTHPRRRLRPELEMGKR